MESEFASRSQGNAGVALGTVGTALGGLSLLSGGMPLLGGLFGGGQQYVSKDTYDVQNKLIEAERANALLAAELNTEKKIVEVYNATNAKINEVYDRVSDRILCLERQVVDNAASQAVINCGYNSAIGILQSQAAQFMSLTSVKIDNSKVCPGWGDVVVSVAPASTTGA
ncbi:MAG: hypothetical protein IKV80_08255 [Bacteroidales bacterium]|nr:hypothetical protein [Bacteroidales bacterium]